jgi:glycosyltransferase involved in cell wall biosynthesis
MNILFIASFYPHKLESKLGMTAKSLYRSSEFLIKGFKANNKIKISVITSPDMVSYPHGQIFIKNHHDIDEKIQIVSSLNISYIKQIWTIFSMFHFAKKLVNSNIGDTIVIIPYMVLRHVIVTRLLKIRFGGKIKVCTIIPDIFFPQKRKILTFWANKCSENFVRKSDCFVLYTKAMAEYLKIQSKPYIIMEGVIDSEIKNTVVSNLSDKKIITYTGSLNIEYGIVRLLETMKLLENSDIELHLLGSGNAEKIIKEYINSDSRIKYLGLQSKEITYQEQINSTILINPRNSSDGEFTKYSFPSKNIEYLAIGKPTILTKLAGMPEEYIPYFIDAGDGSAESLARAILKVLKMSDQERIAFGRKGQKFVIENKDYYTQSNRILKLFESIS